MKKIIKTSLSAMLLGFALTALVTEAFSVCRYPGNWVCVENSYLNTREGRVTSFYTDDGGMSYTIGCEWGLGICWKIGDGYLEVGDVWGIRPDSYDTLKQQ